MFQRILVPLDGSHHAERALPVAARLARASGGLVVLLQVISPPLYYTDQVIEALLAKATSYLATLATSEDLAGIETITDAIFGAPGRKILASAQSRNVDLIVMCSYGQTGFTRWALGSVAHSVVHHSPVPVLVLREDEPISALSRVDTTRPLCALVALDGSLLAEAAVTPAANLVAALAAPGKAALHFTQVVTDAGEEAQERAKAYLAAVKERMQETLKDPKLSITWSAVPATDVADALIKTAEQGEQGDEGFSGGSLIALSTHGQGWLHRWIMGSVTERVLTASKLPVLIVRPQHTEGNASGN